MTNRRRRVRNDVLLALCLLLVAGVCFGLFLLAREAGGHVVVWVDGEAVASYPLSVDRTVVLTTGADGTGRNTLVISGGVAYVTEASCPDGICMGHRAISYRGESIVCLPNRLVVTVE